MSYTELVDGVVINRSSTIVNDNNDPHITED